jgi:hypothetical protein
MEFVKVISMLHKRFDVDVSDFQILRFDVDMLAFFGLETVFGYFLKIMDDFWKSFSLLGDPQEQPLLLSDAFLGMTNCK